MATRSSRKQCAAFARWIRPLRSWWKPLLWFWVSIVLAVVINDVAPWFITENVVGWVIGHIVIVFLLVGSLLLLTGLAGLAYRQEDASTAQTGQQLALPPQHRLQLIRSLHQEYEDRLAHSLQGSIVLDLELRTRADMVASSASLVFYDRVTGETSPLPRGTSILQVYDRVQRGLLILGAPGSGKTTLLLTLAQDLLHRAENEPDQPLVIILNLSSWAREQLPLTQWVVQQCALVYGLPKRLTAAWIEQEQVQFLLDGLDEMEISARTACIEAINAYRQVHLVPLIVCARYQEYELQPARLILPAAVEIQPLETTQVIRTLKQAGKQFAAVRAALRRNAILGDLLTTPLMLSVVLLTYRDPTANQLPRKGSPEEQQRTIFEHYVQRMVQRSQRQRSFSPTRLLASLAWLAQQMEQQGLTEFYLESLQANWLRTRRVRVTYRLVVGLAFGLFVGFFVGLAFGLDFGPSFTSFLVLGVALLFGLALGPFFILAFALDTIKPVEKIIWTWKGLLFGLLFGLDFGLFFELHGGFLANLFTEFDPHPK